MHLSNLASLFDHLVGKHKQIRRNIQPEPPGDLEIDDQIELARLFDSQIRGLAPPQNDAMGQKATSENERGRQLRRLI